MRHCFRFDASSSDFRGLSGFFIINNLFFVESQILVLDGYTTCTLQEWNWAWCRYGCHEPKKKKLGYIRREDHMRPVRSTPCYLSWSHWVLCYLLPPKGSLIGYALAQSHAAESGQWYFGNRRRYRSFSVYTGYDTSSHRWRNVSRILRCEKGDGGESLQMLVKCEPTGRVPWEVVKDKVDLKSGFRNQEKEH